MFGMSGTELAIVLIVALLFLGPTKLPELARSIGKGMREFRRATDDLRSSVESEFYRMDDPPPAAPQAGQALPAADPAAVPAEPLAATPAGEAVPAGEARKQ
jgi:TatA/E family protein of Tat protein translocase